MNRLPDVPTEFPPTSQSLHRSNSSAMINLTPKPGMTSKSATAIIPESPSQTPEPTTPTLPFKMKTYAPRDKGTKPISINQSTTNLSCGPISSNSMSSLHSIKNIEEIQENPFEKVTSVSYLSTEYESDEEKEPLGDLPVDLVTPRSVTCIPSSDRVDRSVPSDRPKFGRMSSNSIQKSHIFQQGSTNLREEDEWMNMVSGVLREKIEDCIDDKKIRDFNELKVAMGIKNPQSIYQMRRIFNELKDVKPQIKIDEEFSNNMHLFPGGLQRKNSMSVLSPAVSRDDEDDHNDNNDGGGDGDQRGKGDGFQSHLSMGSSTDYQRSFEDQLIHGDRYQSLKKMAHRLLAPWLRTESRPFMDRIAIKTVTQFASRKLMDLIQTEDFDSDAVLQYDTDTNGNGNDHDDDADAVFVEWKNELNPDMWNLVQSMVHDERHLLYQPGIYEGNLKYFKTKEAIQSEVNDELCDGSFECSSLRRIKAVLRIYHELKDSEFWGHVATSPLIFFRDSYGHQELFSDFQHIQLVHGLERCKLIIDFERDLGCDIHHCRVFTRHYRDRSEVEYERNLYYHASSSSIKGKERIRDEKEVLVQQLCDQIHCYFLHSMLQYDVNGEEMTDPAAIRRKAFQMNVRGRSYSKMIKPRFSEVQRQQSMHSLHSFHSLHSLHQTMQSSLSRAISLQSSITDNVDGGLIPDNCALIDDDVEDTVDMKDHEHSQSLSTTNMTHNPIVEVEQHEKIKWEDQETESTDIYPGTIEDKRWINDIFNGIGRKDGINEMTNQEIYDKLVEYMGIFRWQALHGFHYNQNRGHHIKPKFDNIKQEVLHNSFHVITSENWNQTLRKAKVFHESWAGKKIRTLRADDYVDPISKVNKSWSKGESITLKEILTLKLYTDFDQLQFELKKCFRFEQIETVINMSRHNTMGTEFENTMEVDDKSAIGGLTAMHDETNRKRKNRDVESKSLLEERLSNFWHWRLSLQITLKKYGMSLGHMNLYHGVNEKMILYPHATTQAFHGPLSTTKSFHVSKTFATDKGMVLKISSMYPRLRYCRAFDASLLSDYPEEQEWLVGFIYTRIRKVHTKEQYKVAELKLASQIRFAFFVTNLFNLQVFSLSEDLAGIFDFFLTQYLKHKERESPDTQQTEVFPVSRLIRSKQSKRVGFDLGTSNDQTKLYNDKWTQLLSGYDSDSSKLSDREKVYCKIMKVLMDKFKSFAIETKIVRIDDISYNIRSHFMVKTGIINGIDTGIPRNRYRISMKKIQSIFVNVEEIYLYNYYCLDDELLDEIIQFLERDSISKQLKQIKFLYYDYKGDIKDLDVFLPEEDLDEKRLQKLEALNWECHWSSHKKESSNGRKFEYGVKIRLRRKQQQ